MRDWRWRNLAATRISADLAVLIIVLGAMELPAIDHEAVGAAVLLGPWNAVPDLPFEPSGTDDQGLPLVAVSRDDTWFTPAPSNPDNSAPDGAGNSRPGA